MKKPDKDTFILFSRAYVNTNRRLNIISNCLKHLNLELTDDNNPTDDAFLKWIELYDLSDAVISCLEDMINDGFVYVYVNKAEIRIDSFENLYDIIYGV